MKILSTWALVHLTQYGKSGRKYLNQQELIPTAYTDEKLFNKLDFKNPYYLVNLIFEDEKVKGEKFLFKLKTITMLGSLSEENAYLKDVVAVSKNFLESNNIQASTGIIRSDYYTLDNHLIK